MDGKNIDLGTFSWDISALETQLINNRKLLEGFNSTLAKNKAIIKEHSKEIRDAAKVMELGAAMQDELNQQMQEGTISEDDYVEAMAAVNKSLAAVREETARMIKEQNELMKANLDTERSVKQLNSENRNLMSLLEAGRTEADQSATAYKDLNKELNALKLEAKNLGAQMVQLEREGKGSGEEYERLRAEWEAVSAKANQLNDDFKRLDKAVGDNQRSVGDYKDQIKSAFAEITSGLFAMSKGDVAGGFESVKNGFAGVKESAGSLFTFLKANPLALILGGIAYFVADMWQYNESVREANKTVEQLANSSGDLTNQLRMQGTAISETFIDKSFEEAILETDNLMKDFKISAEEAWGSYVEGMALGGAKNSEFGDSIREYGQLFAQNGYSAKEFLAILNTGIDLQMYNDKLPDAIKEAGIALSEQTKATRDALVNAFGATFADDILIRIQQGKTSIADALTEISEKAEDANLNQQQLAQLTADVFKGAGEDAGGALAIFEAINSAQQIMKGNLTEVQKATIDLANTNLELEQAKERAYSSEPVRAFQKDVEIYWKKAQIFIYDILDDVVGAFRDSISGYRLAYMNIADIIKDIPKGFAAVFNGVKADLSAVAMMAVTAGAAIKNALSFNVDAAKANIASLQKQITSFSSKASAAMDKVSVSVANINTKNVTKINAQTKAAAQAQAADDEAAKAGGGKVTGATGDARAKADAEAAKASKAAASQRVRDAEQASKERERILEQEAKRALEIERQRADNMVDLAMSELAEYIRLNADKYKNDKTLLQSKLKDQLAYFDEVKRQQLEINELERQSKEHAIQQKIDEIEKKKALNENDKNEIQNFKNDISILNADYKNKELELEAQTAEKKKEINKNYEDAIIEQQQLQRAVAFQQKMIDLEAEGASEYGIRQAQLDNDIQLELDKFWEKNELLREADLENYEIEAEITLARKEIEAEMQLTDDENEKLRLQNQLDQLTVIQSRYAENQKQIDKAVNDAKLQALQGALGTAKGLFKENTLAYKAMAVAEATISTYLSATKALAEVPYPMNYVVMGVNIAAGLAQVAKIVSTKGYSGGGYTGDGGKYEPAGIVHRGEVVWSQEDVAAVGGAAVANAMRPSYRGYATGGIVGSQMPAVQRSISAVPQSLILDENGLSLIADAIYAGSQAGIGDMADNTAIREGGSF